MKSGAEMIRSLDIPRPTQGLLDLPHEILAEAVKDVQSVLLRRWADFGDATALERLGMWVLITRRRLVMSRWTQIAVNCWNAWGEVHAEQLRNIFARRGAGSHAKEIVYDLIDLGLFEKTEDGRLRGKDMCTFCEHRTESRKNVKRASSSFLPIIDNVPRVECKHHRGYGYQVERTIARCEHFKQNELEVAA